MKNLILTLSVLASSAFVISAQASHHKIRCDEVVHHDETTGYFFKTNQVKAITAEDLNRNPHLWVRIQNLLQELKNSYSESIIDPIAKLSPQEFINQIQPSFGHGKVAKNYTEFLDFEIWGDGIIGIYGSKNSLKSDVLVIEGTVVCDKK